MYIGAKSERNLRQCLFQLAHNQNQDPLVSYFGYYLLEFQHLFDFGVGFGLVELVGPGLGFGQPVVLGLVPFGQRVGPFGLGSPDVQIEQLLKS